MLVLLAAFVAIKLRDAGPKHVSLSTLVLDQSQYVGAEINTSGTLRRFTDPNGSSYYILTDPEQDRVIVRPATAAAAYLHRHVTITGKFEFDPHAGRILKARHVQ
ncbi:MAG: hypothetical protein ACRDK8_01910, partial [Solirubrobacteraceae bacterium]